MGFVKKPEFLNHQTFINYPVDSVSYLLNINKSKFPGREISIIGCVVKSLEKIVNSLKKVWSEIQIQYTYGISRRQLKQDLCKRITFALGYIKSENAHFEPAEVKEASLRSRFGSSVRGLRLLNNLKKEKEAVETKFGFLAKPQKNNQMHQLFSETNDSIQQRIKGYVDSLCEIIESASAEDKVYFQKYFTDSNCLKPLSEADQERINLGFVAT